jgi:hypothetical protein
MTFHVVGVDGEAHFCADRAALAAAFCRQSQPTLGFVRRLERQNLSTKLLRAL